MGDRRDEVIVPHNHSAIGAAATRAGGTAGGAVKGGFETVGKVIAGLAIAGVILGFVWGIGGFAAINAGLEAGAALVGAVGKAVGLSSFNIWPMVGLGLAGGIIGMVISPLTGLFGTVKGGFDGYDKADTRIAKERGAAKMLEADIAALRMQSEAYAAQAQMGAMPQRPGDRYANASTMLLADSNAIQAAQLEGRMNGLQLEAGRG